MLTYRLIPAATVATTHWCLILHGLGDDLSGWAPVAEALQIPGLGCVLVQAPEPYVQGYSWFPVPGLTDAQATMADLQAGLARSRLLVEELVTSLCARLAVSQDRLLLLGFSQGCVMVVETALRSAERYAGVIGISGWLPMAEAYPTALGAAARHQPILWTHGDCDDLLPVVRTAAIVRRLQDLDLNIDWRIYTKGHELDGAQEFPQIRAWIQDRVADFGRNPAHG